METAAINELISSLGFPIVCVLALGYFAWYMVQHSTKTAADNMEKVQARCKEREERLYKELEECHKINGEAVKVISEYANRLDNIQDDVRSIKTDITVIKTRVE